VQTRRQHIVELLEEGEYGFEELRQALEVPVHLLKTDLEHVEKTVRGSGRRLAVTPPRCYDCGFVFRGRGTKHFHAPSRCPECRSEQVSQPRLRIE
jgi:predicted Zn-ribbon and HTH transcriptional regulator